MCKSVSHPTHVDRVPTLTPTMHASISVKTKVQQRAMAGEMYRSPGETFYRLIRGESRCLRAVRARGY